MEKPTVRYIGGKHKWPVTGIVHPVVIKQRAEG